MRVRALAFLLLLPAVLFAAKNIATATGENQDFSLAVTLYIDPESVNQIIGAKMDPHYIVAEVRLTPKPGKEVFVDRDDFLLRTDKDGEKTRPFAPSQIAGRGALIVSRRAGGGGGIMAGQGPSGYPGGYPPYPGGGRPPTVGGTAGEGDTAESEVSMRHPARDKENPLERTLKDREVPQGKTAVPVSGLLYFGMEKQKLKDLELIYGGRENRISLRFK